MRGLSAPVSRARGAYVWHLGVGTRTILQARAHPGDRPHPVLSGIRGVALRARRIVTQKQNGRPSESAKLKSNKNFSLAARRNDLTVDAPKACPVHYSDRFVN
jgi:hypothetical protein